MTVQTLDPRPLVPLRVRTDRRPAVLSIGAFWLYYYGINTLRMAVVEAPNQGDMAIRRCVVTMGGAVLTYLLYLTLRGLEGHSLRTQATAAFALSAPLAIVYALLNTMVFYGVHPTMVDRSELEHLEELHLGVLALVVDAALSWYFFICCWAVFYLTLSFASKARQVERQAAQYRAAAQTAQLRALRYQINPHFLFNTLNSLSTLVLRQRTAEADRMIVTLSNFFRSSLTSDPSEDVTLDDEIRLQELYLDIERVRFPDRLKVEFDIPAGLRQSSIPALLIQPLVENAIKYGVAATSRPVTVLIRAALRGQGQLCLTVEDDGGTGVAPTGFDQIHETAIGLRNVRDRLAARYGDAASLSFGSRDGGGFRAVICLPTATDV